MSYKANKSLSTTLPVFTSSREAARRQIDQVKPDLYAKTRNRLDGAVTFLSPWLTHGWTDTKEVAQVLSGSHNLDFAHKLVFELGWREFFHHAHSHLGSKIFKDVREPVYAGKYQRQLPMDIDQACTGVPVIDASIQALYDTGYLHNHARMWLASYVTHLRKVHWSVGANWMYRHLLDGDLASNHLSWQWVAGTFSSKPYVFNADNVAKYGPSLASPGTVLDTDYEHLNVLARHEKDVGPEPHWGTLSTTPQPACHHTPPRDAEPPLVDLTATATHTPEEQAALSRLRGHAIRLIHPWNLGDLSREDGKLKIGLLDNAFHRQFAWSSKRWKFVLDGLNQCDFLMSVDSSSIESAKKILTDLKCAEITSRDTLNPGYQTTLIALCEQIEPTDAILPDPPYFAKSFSKFYRSSVSRVGSLEAALHNAAS